MAKRKISHEIKELKVRGEFDNGLNNSQRISDIKELLKVFKQNNKREFDEFFRYIPIACVACIESFYREAIKSLVDKGGIYFDNLENLLSKSGQKIDFEILSNLQKKQFTIGEFISHTLSCNNINDLQNNLSIILGLDFLGSLKKYKPIVFGEYDNESFYRLNKNYDSVISSIVKIFELRHIFCHESGTNIMIDRTQLEIDLENCELFLNNSSNFICSKVYENWGLTTHDKVDLLQKELETKAKEIDIKIKNIRTKRSKIILESNDFELTSRKEVQKDFQKRFDNTVKSWKKYIDAKALLKSRYSMSYIWSEYIFLKDKIKSIDDFFEDIY